MNVKRMETLLAVVLLVLALAPGVQAKQDSKSKAPAAGAATAKPGDAQAATHTVIVYYLYMEPRCETCKTIEKYTREALEQAFPKELKNGRLVWMPLDVKKEGNWHYVEDFQISSKSVIAADYKGLKEDKKKLLFWKNLEDIWTLVKDKDKFMKYIQDQTRILLDQKYEVEKKEEPGKGK
jgi:hypothetical protein